MDINEMNVIGESIMQDALCGGDMYEELKRIKSELQIIITEQLTQNELMDVAFSRKNETVISKLITVGRKIYSRNNAKQRLYMTAVSIATIIKEYDYDWGEDYLQSAGLLNLINQLYVI